MAIVSAQHPLHRRVAAVTSLPFGKRTCRFPRNSLRCLTVKPVPGTLQGGGASFRTTHWSAISDCSRTDEQGSEALGQLCRDYWPPLYSFVRRRGYSPSDAQDLVQGFFSGFL